MREIERDRMRKPREGLAQSIGTVRPMLNMYCDKAPNAMACGDEVSVRIHALSLVEGILCHSHSS